MSDQVLPGKEAYPHNREQQPEDQADPTQALWSTVTLKLRCETTKPRSLQIATMPLERAEDDRSHPPGLLGHVTVVNGVRWDSAHREVL